MWRIGRRVPGVPAPTHSWVALPRGRSASGRAAKLFARLAHQETPHAPHHAAPPETMDPDQRRVYDKIVSGPRGRIQGPLRAALHNAELAERGRRWARCCATAPRCRRG